MFFFSSDCGIIASRLQINLDDLLWVLTDSQLKAALVFVNSLKDIVAKSARLSKKLAAERLKVCVCVCVCVLARMVVQMFISIYVEVYASKSLVG